MRQIHLKAGEDLFTEIKAQANNLDITRSEYLRWLHREYTIKNPVICKECGARTLEEAIEKCKQKNGGECHGKRLWG